MEQRERDFHLEEYKQIRAEMAALLARVESLFKYSLIVTATIYAWLIVQSVGLSETLKPCLRLPYPLLGHGWKIPPVFVLFAGLIAFATYWRVRQMGEYLLRIEKDLGSASLGWEAFLKEKKPMVTSTTAAGWVLLFIATLVGTCKGIDVMTDAIGTACKTEAAKSGG